MKKRIVLCAMVLALALLLCPSAAAADGVAAVDGVEYGTLAEAIAAANLKSGAVVDVLADCSVAGTAELTQPMTITSSVGATVTVTGGSYGFRIGKGKGGDYGFSGLEIRTDSALSCISVQAYNAQEPVSVKVENCTLENTKKTAIDLEGTSSDKPNDYFDLSVKNCVISASAYGIGSGLDNSVTTVDGSALTVTGTSFNADGRTGIYGIHTPMPLKALTVVGCSFAHQGSGGIKYQYTDLNKVAYVITDNDFSKCNAAVSGSSYALMISSFVQDITDKYSYCYATELSGNDFRGQNVLILAKAKLEVIWFPDGQSKNAPELNNLGDENITDAGTRYAVSAYGGTKIALTDFGISASGLYFAPGTDAKTTGYFYNTSDNSGFYTNSLTGCAADGVCWSTENPRHCSGRISDFADADSITRFFLDGVALVPDASDPRLLVGENAVARVAVDRKTGDITVTPLAEGNAVLTATVGAGADGTLPNAKSDTLKIGVGALYPVTYHSHYPKAINKDNVDFDGGEYTSGSPYAVLSGALAGFDAGAGNDFLGWATSLEDADKAVITYYAGDELKIPEGETNLYAVWTATLGESRLPKTPATSDLFLVFTGAAFLASVCTAVILSARWKKKD